MFNAFLARAGSTMHMACTVHLNGGIKVSPITRLRIEKASELRSELREALEDASSADMRLYRSGVKIWEEQMRDLSEASKGGGTS